MSFPRTVLSILAAVIFPPIVFYYIYRFFFTRDTRQLAARVVLD